MNETIHDKLAAKFDVGELKFFPVAFTKDKAKARVGSYIDARAVMDRLDSVVGTDAWQTCYELREADTKAVECRLSVLFGDTWITKADVGYPNEARDADNPDKEPIKAAYSDALKRAAVQFGIGRYIYSLELEQDWLPVDQYGKFTQQPRLKGAPRQEVEDAPAGPRPKPTPIKRTGFYETLADMGYTRETVDNESQRTFGNREPKDLDADERRRLVVVLEEAKKAKETASA